MISARVGKNSRRTDRGELKNKLETLNSRLNFLIKRLSCDGDLPSDSEQWRLRKAVLILLSVTYTILGIFWGITYFSLGRPLCVKAL
jgi:hypothetical protein